LVPVAEVTPSPLFPLPITLSLPDFNLVSLSFSFYSPVSCCGHIILTDGTIAEGVSCLSSPRGRVWLIFLMFPISPRRVPCEFYPLFSLPLFFRFPSPNFLFPHARFFHEFPPTRLPFNFHWPTPRYSSGSCRCVFFFHPNFYCWTQFFWPHPLVDFRGKVVFFTFGVPFPVFWLIFHPPVPVCCQFAHGRL